MDIFKSRCKDENVFEKQLEMFDKEIENLKI